MGRDVWACGPRRSSAVAEAEVLAIVGSAPTPALPPRALALLPVEVGDDVAFGVLDGLLGVCEHGRDRFGGLVGLFLDGRGVLEGSGLEVS